MLVAVAIKLTLWLLKVSMTVSAAVTSAKPISAMTVGLAEMSLQYSRSPPTLRITLSMSAAVVPGAKLLATTTYGPPAAPLMLMIAEEPALRVRWRRGSCCCSWAEVWLGRGHCEVLCYSSEGWMLCAVVAVRRVDRQGCSTTV
jgi:hypothetical protein